MFNFVRTGVLLAVMTALFMAVGYFIGGTSGMIIAFGVAVVMNLISLLELRQAGAQRAGRAADRSARRRPISTRWSRGSRSNAGMPMPKIYVIETDQPNAFATGRNPQNAAVAVSRGLLQALEPREVAAVIAHELAHIRSRDTLTMTVTATLAGAISMLAQFGLFFGGGNNRDNPLGGIGALLMVFLAPGRRGAGADGGEPHARIRGRPRRRRDLGRSAGARLGARKDRALRQDASSTSPAERNPAMAHLYIANPLTGQRMDNLFSTHPAPENRIAALQQIAGEMQIDRTGRRPEPRPNDPGSRAATAGWRVPAAGRAAESTTLRGPWG